MERRNIVIVLGIIALILMVGLVILKPREKGKGKIGPGGREELIPSPGKISLEEKELIETWLKEDNLNQYGDSQDTVYIGGTPLFDEKIGQRIDRYEYILQRHPDRPWRE